MKEASLLYFIFWISFACLIPLGKGIFALGISALGDDFLQLENGTYSLGMV
jgi:hypothetical protein